MRELEKENIDITLNYDTREFQKWTLIQLWIVTKELTTWNEQNNSTWKCVIRINFALFI